MLSSHPWTDMQDAFWEHLRTEHDFQALGLREYPSHEGKLIPYFVDTGMLPDGALPCLGTLVVKAGTESQGGIDSRRREFVTVKGILVFKAVEANASSRDIEKAMTVIRDRLDTNVNRQTLNRALSAPGGSADSKWTMGNGPVPMRVPGKPYPSQWNWPFEITLFGTGRHR